jgi:FkbM family methyltransferase
MNNKLKQLLTPFVNVALRILEIIKGFKTDPTGYIPNRFRMLTNSYEPFLIKTILNLLPVKGVFVDVGANVGYVSRRIAEARPDASNIVAVEPNPRLNSILKFNLRNFTRCIILPFGFGSVDAVLKFYQGKDSAVGSFVKGFNELHDSNNPAYKTETFSVPVKKGAILLKDYEVINVMKVDVEGFELEAFKGLEESFNSGKIRNIVFEFNPLSQTAAGVEVMSTIHFLKSHNFIILGLEGGWHNIEITENNINSLLNELGRTGYTTLLATLA